MINPIRIGVILNNSQNNIATLCYLCRFVKHKSFLFTCFSKYCSSVFLPFNQKPMTGVFETPFIIMVAEIY